MRQDGLWHLWEAGEGSCVQGSGSEFWGTETTFKT